MRRFLRTVALVMLVVMTLYGCDWPYFDEISDALGAQLQQATVVPAGEEHAAGDQGTTPSGRVALQYELLVMLQGVVSAPSQVLPVDPPSAGPGEVTSLFHSEIPQGLERPPQVRSHRLAQNSRLD